MLAKFENLIQRKKIVFSLFIFLILCQLCYSFLFTGSNLFVESWKSIEELNSFKGYSYDSFDNSIVKKIYPLVSNHRISSDAGGQMLLAHDFPQHYFRGHPAYLNRPLYAFLVYLISRPLHLISDSYSLTFAAGILLNFILFFFTISLFYLLVKKLISLRVAFLSSILLIFSPLVHIWIVQPETEIFGLFFITLTLYLLYNYITHPCFKKLVIFSLVVGVLMLGKMIPAISLFILILAIYFKRYKQGALFIIIHLIPLALWYLWTTKIWGLSYCTSDITVFKMFLIDNWLLNIFQWPWQKTFQVFLLALPSFISSVIYGFLLIPVIFAIIGFNKLWLRRKNLFLFSFIFSFFALFFVMNYYTPRHGFLIFPIVYPLAVLGIDRIAKFLKRYKAWYALVFYLMVFLFLIIISNVNVFKIFDYATTSPWLR